MIKEKIRDQAFKLGYDLVGFASATQHAHLSFYKRWLEKKYQGEMKYLERHFDPKSNPQSLLPNAKSFICVALNYNPGPPPNPNDPLIARYTVGLDYHHTFKTKLQQLADFIQKELDPTARLRVFVDTGPILERSYAVAAGLGWIGKNTLLINRKMGSWLFLGEILTDMDLMPDSFETDHCGTCTRCIDACPTQALTPYELKATQCISYWTLEQKSEFSEYQKNNLGNHLAGCDICQEVCPWNRKAPLTQHPEFYYRPELQGIDWHDPQTATVEFFDQTFKPSSMHYMGFDKYYRNLMVCNANEMPNQTAQHERS